MSDQDATPAAEEQPQDGALSPPYEGDAVADAEAQAEEQARKLKRAELKRWAKTASCLADRRLNRDPFGARIHNDAGLASALRGRGLDDEAMAQESHAAGLLNDEQAEAIRRSLTGEE